MKRLRMSRYTPQAAREVRAWIESTLGEQLPNGDLLELLKDGTILCRYDSIRNNVVTIYLTYIPDLSISAFHLQVLNLRNHLCLSFKWRIYHTSYVPAKPHHSTSIRTIDSLQSTCTSQKIPPKYSSVSEHSAALQILFSQPNTALPSGLNGQAP
jgi:hypothetical protein